MSQIYNRAEIQPNPHVGAVMARISEFGRCLIEGERGGGKTDSLGPILSVLGDNVFFIDGHEDAQSPELLEATRIAMDARFEAYRSRIFENDMAIVIDHVPHLWNIGENIALNEQRIKLAGSLANMMAENVTILIVTDGRAPSPFEDTEVPKEIADLAATFTDDQTYRFDKNSIVDHQYSDEEMKEKVKTLAGILGLPTDYVHRLRSKGGDQYVIKALELAGSNSALA